MDTHINTIVHGDCIAGMQELGSGTVDLAFADPPFNIGYEYDVYKDKKGREEYLAWSRDWIAAVYRALKDDGTFWLAIGDEYAAELKMLGEDVGFHTRSWVIWYYTFGVNCSHKFTRSHAHLFYFVKDPETFTFRTSIEDGVRIPSARQLVYNDKRANPKGRLPDDTWITRPADCDGAMTTEPEWLASVEPPRDDDRTWTLRPQDLDNCFQESEATWYFPRVAGTFKERAGFHGCQMPEQLLGRIIKCCSHEGDVVLDPFSGSATTPAVAKKLGRRYVAFDLSDSYVEHGLRRLDSICVGDRLDGAPEPTLSAPKTHAERNSKPKGKAKNSKSKGTTDEAAAIREREFDDAQREMTMSGIVEAFRYTHGGFSVDRIIADPELNDGFTAACRKIGLVGEPRVWNTLLFRLRKAGRLVDIETVSETCMSWQDCDGFVFASEIALQSLLDDDRAESLDEILCCPRLADDFDQIARRFAPGRTSFEYRWAALKLRKQASLARSRASVLVLPSRLGNKKTIDNIDFSTLPNEAGAYLLTDEKKQHVYAGETLNVRDRITQQFSDDDQRTAWSELSSSMNLQTFPIEANASQALAWQSCLVRKYKPKLNYQELRG